MKPSHNEKFVVYPWLEEFLPNNIQVESSYGVRFERHRSLVSLDWFFFRGFLRSTRGLILPPISIVVIAKILSYLGSRSSVLELCLDHVIR